jgi:hypothetical protein
MVKELIEGLFLTLELFILLFLRPLQRYQFHVPLTSAVLLQMHLGVQT